MFRVTRLMIAVVCFTVALIAITATTDAAPKKKNTWWKAGQPRFAKSDLGRIFSGTIDLRGSGRQTTLKAIAIRVGDSLEVGKTATVLFDTDLLRISGAVPDHFVMLNTFRDRLGGSGHWVGAPYLFTTRREPGWVHDGSFKDPRPKPTGPLKRDVGKYRGLYRHGNRTVLSYTVGQTTVLESPWLEGDGKLQPVSRTLEVGPSAQPMRVKLCDVSAAAAALKDTAARTGLVAIGSSQDTYVGLIPDAASDKAVKLDATDQAAVVAEIAPHTTTLRFKVLLWSGDKEVGKAFPSLLAKSPEPMSLEPLTKPGPPQWTKEIITEGKLGTGNGPYVVDTIAAPYKNPYKALMTFAGHDFFANGDAAICTIHGDVWRVSGLDGDLKKITWKRYATGLFQPLGLKIVDNKAYVLGRDQITRLHDNNGDGEVDFYECFNNECKIGKHVHEYTVCLETDPQGNFYYVKGTNGGQSEHDGSVVRVSKDGSKFEIFATGFRWPNGGGVGPDGTVTVADQQGNWVPASRLDIVKKGGFYGYMPAHHRKKKPKTYDGPLCWIPHKVDNSCGGQAWIAGDRWGLANGRMLHLSYGKCTMFLVVQDKIGEVDQGGVVPFGLRFLSGSMRGRFRQKDGQFYVSGLRGWQTSAAKDGCFQRVRYTGKPTHMPTELKVHKNGLLVSFSEPVDRKVAGNWENWGVEHWNYRWTGRYGSREYKVSNPKKTGHDELEIDEVYVSKDGKTVFLEVADLQPVMQMKIQYNIATADGKKLSNAIYNTIHVLRPNAALKSIGDPVKP